MEWEDDWGRGRGGRTAVVREGRMVEAEWLTRGKEGRSQEAGSKEAHTPACNQRRANTQEQHKGINEKMRRTGRCSLEQGTSDFAASTLTLSQHCQAGQVFQRSL